MMLSRSKTLIYLTLFPCSHASKLLYEYFLLYVAGLQPGSSQRMDTRNSKNKTKTKKRKTFQKSSN